MTIQIACSPVADGWRCRVAIYEDNGSTLHDVTVHRADLGRLDPGAVDPEQLVRRSFEFLLEREAKESILADFDLPVISDYYPDYEATLRR